MRAVISALIGTELTARELREAADELCRYPLLKAEDAEQLVQLLDALTDVPQKTLGGEIGQSREELALRYIERRRLSKREVFDLMEKSFRMPIGDFVSTDVTRSEMVSKFFGTASSAAIQRFLDVIAPTAKDDPYLRGIMRRTS